MDPPAVPDEDTPEPSVVLPEDPPSPVQWQQVGELSVDDFGDAGWVSVPFPAEQRYVAVRTVPLHPGPDAETRACHQVVEARLASGAPLDEHQGFAPGPGGGVFMLSSVITPLDLADTLELHVALIDCALGIPASRARFPHMPHTLIVELATEAARTHEPLDATLAVRIIRAEDSGWRSEDPAFAEAWAVAAERFADVGVELVLEAQATSPATGTIRYTADMLGFDAIDREVREQLQADSSDTRFVPVALVRCLEYDDATSSRRFRPLGQTTRIPGSLADARTPSLVVLAAGDCDDGSEPELAFDAQRLGVVLAHEIAHYLGLWHVDFDGAHLAGDEGQRLMHSTIAEGIDPSDAWFSPAQATVLRRHPDVVFAP